MSKKVCSPDNSACEGFFGRMKTECFYNHSLEDLSLKHTWIGIFNGIITLESKIH